MLVAQRALRSQLTKKGAVRPTNAMKKIAPSGANDVQVTPARKEFASGARGEDEWCDAVDEATATLAKANRAQSTSHEHDQYMWAFDQYLQRKGHGSFVSLADMNASRRTAKSSSTGRLVPTVNEKTGENLIVRPQMLLVWLLDMAAGSEDTPKSGHPDDTPFPFGKPEDRVVARKPRKQQKRKKGEFGYGPYGHEPWSLQAIEKRVYAVRDFYACVLRGTTHDNPGWDDRVCGALSTLRALIGYKPKHVPEVRVRAHLRMRACQHVCVCA